MKDLAKTVMEATSMTSVEIADLLKVTHEEVVKVIKEISEEGAIHPSLETENGYDFEGEQGRLDCIVVMTRFEPKMISAIIKRMEYLKQEIAKAEREAEEKKKSRNLYYKMEGTIKEVNNLASIEDIKIETDMINNIVFSMTLSDLRIHRNIPEEASIRDMMTKTELEALNRLQEVNESLYRCGFDMKTRREKLEEIYDEDFNQRLIGEFMRLEA